jgi:hypothetical protein
MGRLPDITYLTGPVLQVLHSTRMNHAKYENLIAKLLNGERLPREVSSLDAS